MTCMKCINNKKLTQKEFVDFIDVLVEYRLASLATQWRTCGKLKQIGSETGNPQVLAAVNENLRFIRQDKKLKPFLKDAGKTTENLIISCVEVVLPQ